MRPSWARVLLLCYALASCALPAARAPTTPATATETTTALGPTIVVTPEATRTPFLRTPPRVTPPSPLPTIVTPTISYTETATPGPIPTSAPAPAVVAEGPFKGWYLYENREFGFRLKFPPQYAFYTPFAEPGARPYKESLFTGFFYDKTEYPPPGGVGSTRSAISLTVFDNPKRLSSADAFVRAYLDPSSGGSRPDSAVHFGGYDNAQLGQTGGVQVVRFIDSVMGIQVPTMVAPLQNASRMLRLNHCCAKSLVPVFDSMISTLEFIR